MTDPTPPSDGIDTRSGRFAVGTTEPVDAATVLLLRDGDEGLEVFLLERHMKSDFAGGAYAFPGGKVDAQDMALPDDRWTGIDPARVVDLVGGDSPEHAVGILVAAVRETFEEAGPLLARHADGRPVTGEDLATESFLDARRRLATRGEHWDWTPWLEEQDLVLDLGALHPVARWCTPHGMHKRFDTRFVAAAVPPEQLDALGHDDIETTDSVWRRPADALAAFEAGEVVIIFPTRHTLQDLGQHADVATAMATPGDPRRILPAVVLVDGQPRVRHPDGGEPAAI